MASYSNPSRSISPTTSFKFDNRVENTPIRTYVVPNARKTNPPQGRYFDNLNEAADEDEEDDDLERDETDPVDYSYEASKSRYFWRKNESRKSLL